MRLLEFEVRAAEMHRLHESLAYIEMARQLGKDLGPSDTD
jgi:hypothetical protein